MRKLTEVALTYGFVMAIGFIFYIALTRSPAFDGIHILFYRGILLAGATAAIMLATGLALRRRLGLVPETLTGAVALSLAFNLCFLITFPVTFDRSITMFLLARIEQHDGRLDMVGLQQLFVREYLGEMRQIERRVNEQSLSGNIRVEQRRIHITPQGRRLLAGSRTIGGWFGADPRFVTAPPAPPQSH